MKILIVKRDKLGDMLMTTPALRVLRQAVPSASIHLLASDYSAWVVDGNADLDRVWRYSRFRTGRRVHITAAFDQIRLYWHLRREQFDVVIAAGGDESPRAIERALAVKGKRTIAYANSPHLQTRLTDPMAVPIALHESKRIANQLKPLGVEIPDPLPPPVFFPSTKSMTFAHVLLKKWSMRPGEFIVMGTGARFPEKQPSAQQIIRWSKHILERYGLKTVFIWTPGSVNSPMYRGDDALAADVLRNAGEHLFPLTTETQDIQQIIGVMQCARYCIFPDSGLMHFAAATPGGVVGLFASTWAEPEQWSPIGERVETLVRREPLSLWSDSEIEAAIARLMSQTSPTFNS